MFGVHQKIVCGACVCVSVVLLFFKYFFRSFILCFVVVVVVSEQVFEHSGGRSVAHGNSTGYTLICKYSIDNNLHN